MIKYTVDRIEEGLVVLLLREDENVHINIPESELPPHLKEGDIVNIKLDSNYKPIDVEIMEDETVSTREKAEALLKKILDKNT